MSQSYRPLLALAALGLCAAPLAAQGFEGVVTFKVGPEGHPMTQTYKGGMVRTEVNENGRQAVMLMDNSAAKWTVLMPQQKMYMTMDMKAMSDRMQGMANDKADQSPPKITDTGKSETIAGHTCQVYRMEDNKGEQIEMCAAKGMGYFMMGAGNPMGRGRGPMSGLGKMASNPAYEQMFKDGFFPLRVSQIKGGKTEVVMVATSITPKSVDASLFAVPAGYTEMKMPGMGPRP